MGAAVSVFASPPVTDTPPRHCSWSSSGVVIIWCGHHLVRSSSGVVIIWCGHHLVWSSSGVVIHLKLTKLFQITSVQFFHYLFHHLYNFYYVSPKSSSPKPVSNSTCTCTYLNQSFSYQFLHFAVTRRHMTDGSTIDDCTRK